jgi:hypothetical protein
VLLAESSSESDEYRGRLARWTRELTAIAAPSHPRRKVRDISKPSGFSSGGGLQRVIDAARSPEWSIGEGRAGQIMATRDSGQIGLPWVITADRTGKGMRVSLYRPGDDVRVEGDVIGEISGNPREMGRQFRAFLENTGINDEG